MKKNLKNGDPKRIRLMKLKMWTWHVGFMGETAIFLPIFLPQVFSYKEMKQFYKFMHGQTGPMIGDIMAYYPGDIERFILGQPNID